jgi:hypothetical protein
MAIEDDQMIDIDKQLKHWFFQHKIGGVSNK